MPSDEQIARLTTQVESLSSQVAQLRARLDSLERSRQVSSSMIPPSRETAATAQVASPPALAANTGLKLLNRAGALTLFIGIIFFFKYAVDNQWIGASGRVALGVIAGFALLGTGEWLRKRGQTVFAQGLTACGFATLYISAYAACDYYKLINAIAAFLAFVAISAAAVALSLRHNDAFLALIGYLSATAAPGLLRLMEPNLWSSSVWAWLGFVYLLLVNALALMQIGAQKKNVLVPFLSVATGLSAFGLVNPGHPVACVLFFLALAALHFRPPKQATKMPESYVLGHVFVLMAGIRFLFFWFADTPVAEARRSLLSETESVLLAIYGVALLISAVRRKSATDRVLGLVLLGIVIGKLYVVDVWVLTRFYRISAFVALGFLLLASSFVYSRWKRGVGF